MNYSVRQFCIFILVFSIVLPQSLLAQKIKVPSKVSAKIVSNLNRTFSLKESAIILKNVYTGPIDKSLIDYKTKQAQKKLNSERVFFSIENNNNIVVNYFDRKQFSITVINIEKKILEINGKKISFSEKNFKKLYSMVESAFGMKSDSRFHLFLPKAYAEGTLFVIVAIFVGLIVLNKYDEWSSRGDINDATEKFDEAKKKCENGDKERAISLANKVPPFKFDKDKDKVEVEIIMNCQLFAAKTDSLKPLISTYSETLLFCNAYNELLSCLWPELKDPPKLLKKGDNEGSG